MSDQIDQPSTSKDDLGLGVYQDDDELEEEISNALMTQSYSEISFKSGNASPNAETMNSTSSPPPNIESNALKRPATLSYNLQNYSTPNKSGNYDGTFHREGNMVHYVADDLEYKIKLSSPISKKTSSRLGSIGRNSASATMPQVLSSLDVNLLQDLEYEAQHLATSVDSLTENLCEILQSISSLTAQNIDVYKDAVTKMSEAMDSNIKSMYTMMAKAEEVTISMKNVQGYAQRIKEIRRLVDLFENYL